MGGLLAGSATADTYRNVTTDVGVTDVHSVAGICNPPIGMGAAWADVDDDGDVDLFVTDHGGANKMYRNEGDITFDGIPDFTDRAVEMGLADPAGVGLSATFVDYDNDGDQDLYVTNWNGNTLYQNQLADTGFVGFVDVTFFAGLEDYGRTITTAWADFDLDGDLDVFLAKHGECNDFFGASEDQLYVNNGNGRFTNRTEWLCEVGSCHALDTGLGFSPAWVDYDRDGDLDLYVVNDNIDHDGSHHENVMWRNDGPDGNGGWLFTDASAVSGTGKDVNGMGLSVGDFDNDGWYDFAFSNIGKNSLLRNLGDGSFEDLSVSAGIEREFLPNAPTERSITWGTGFFDYNNDMLLDLFFVAGYINIVPFEHPNALFENNGDLTFTDVSSGSGLDDDGRGRSLSMADFDRDGYVDVIVGNWGQSIQLYRNEAALEGNTNHWMGITLAGTQNNRDAIGAEVKVETLDGTEQIRLISSGTSHGGGDERIAHFGLGTHTTADVTIVWPDGEEQFIGPLIADEYHHVEEGLYLASVEPGIAGEVNTIRIYGAEAGGRIGMFGSLNEGNTPFAPCPGTNLDLDNAVLLGDDVADINGNVVRTLSVPATLSGQTAYFQPLQQNGCAVGNVLEVTFQ